MAGTIKLVVANDNAPVISIVMLRATPVVPLGIVIVVLAPDPSVMAWVTYPEMDCSISVPRLVLVVVPQVPDCSPVPISSIARFVL